MSLPWGVKETVDADHADDVSAFIDTAEASDITVGERKAKLLKFGLKQVKDKHLLIYRYQLH